MKLAGFLILSIFYWVLWTFVKTIPIRKSLARHALKDCSSTDHSKILDDEAGSSVNPPIQKYKETLKPKLKITKKDRNKGKDKKVNKIEYKKEYCQKNKERMAENSRNYYERNKEKVLERKRNYQKQNKEKINEYKRDYYKRNKDRLDNKAKKCQYMKIYYQKNKEMVLKKHKIYRQKNREKYNESKRKYQQKKKNVESDNNEGTLFVNPQTGDFINKGKLPIVCEEEGNLFNQEEEECNNYEDEQNQIEVEEPNKILEDNTNHIDLNKKIHSFDLNEKPEDEELEDY